jgi:hypothetical protein
MMHEDASVRTLELLRRRGWRLATRAAPAGAGIRGGSRGGRRACRLLLRRRRCRWLRRWAGRARASRPHAHRPVRPARAGRHADGALPVGLLVSLRGGSGVASASARRAYRRDRLRLLAGKGRQEGCGGGAGVTHGSAPWRQATPRSTHAARLFDEHAAHTARGAPESVRRNPHRALASRLLPPRHFIRRGQHAAALRDPRGSPAATRRSQRSPGGLTRARSRGARGGSSSCRRRARAAHTRARCAAVRRGPPRHGGQPRAELRRAGERARRADVQQQRARLRAGPAGAPLVWLNNQVRGLGMRRSRAAAAAPRGRGAPRARAAAVRRHVAAARPARGGAGGSSARRVQGARSRSNPVALFCATTRPPDAPPPQCARAAARQPGVAGPAL